MASSSSSSPRPALIIVMGTSGCGKSSIGVAVAQALGCPFVDGDDLHPTANVAKMSSGNPLNDDDRLPWLLSIRSTARTLTSPEGQHAFSTHSIPHHLEPAFRHVHPLTHPGQKLSETGEAVMPTTEAIKGRRPAVVVGCSALKVKYRDLLRGRKVPGFSEEREDENELETFFIYLHGTRTLLLKRMEARPGHFFKASMLDSQLATLERPNPDEEDNVHVLKLGRGEDESEERGIPAVSEEAAEIAKKWTKA